MCTDLVIVAVQQGIISSDPDDAYNNDICNNYG